MKTSVESLRRFEVQAERLSGQRMLRVLEGVGPRARIRDPLRLNRHLAKAVHLSQTRATRELASTLAKRSWPSGQTSVASSWLHERPAITELAPSTATGIDGSQLAKRYLRQLPRWERISSDYTAKLAPAVSGPMRRRIASMDRLAAPTAERARVAELRRSLDQLVDARLPTVRSDLVRDLSVAARLRGEELFGPAYASAALKTLRTGKPFLGHRYATRELNAFNDLLRDLGVTPGLAGRGTLNAELSRLTKAQIDAGFDVGPALEMLKGLRGSRAFGPGTVPNLRPSIAGLTASAQMTRLARSALTRSQIERMAASWVEGTFRGQVRDLPWTAPSPDATPLEAEPEPADGEVAAASAVGQPGPVESAETATETAARISRLRAMGLWVAEYPAWPLARTLYLLPLQSKLERLTLLGAWYGALERSFAVIDRAAQPLSVSFGFAAVGLMLTWSLVYYLAGREPGSDA